MEHVVEVDEANRLIIVRVSGDVTVRNLVPVALQERIVARDMGYGVIFDFRQVRPQISNPEVFYWLDKHYNAIDQSIKYVRTAHIASPANFEFFSFVELVWSNRGAHLRVFEDESDAVAWLGLPFPQGRMRPLREALIAG